METKCYDVFARMRKRVHAVLMHLHSIYVTPVCIPVCRREIDGMWSVPELHRAVRSRQCQVGTPGSEQREDTEEDGGLRTDRAGRGGKGG